MLASRNLDGPALGSGGDLGNSVNHQTSQVACVVPGPLVWRIKIAGPTFETPGCVVKMAVRQRKGKTI